MKVFFYLLDVRTSNVLVLFREIMNSNINAVEYKKGVNLLMGSRLKTINAPIAQYKLVRVKGEIRLSYAYCSAFSINNKRTRHVCQHHQCRLPLCLVESNKDNNDSYTLVHRSKEMRNTLCKRLRQIKNTYNNRLGIRRGRNNNQ